MGGEVTCLNSKSEYNRCKLGRLTLGEDTSRNHTTTTTPTTNPTTTPTTTSKQYPGRHPEEGQEEDEQVDDGESRVLSWERKKAVEKRMIEVGRNISLERGIGMSPSNKRQMEKEEEESGKSKKFKHPLLDQNWGEEKKSKDDQRLEEVPPPPRLMQDINGERVDDNTPHTPLPTIGVPPPQKLTLDMNRGRAENTTTLPPSQMLMQDMPKNRQVGVSEKPVQKSVLPKSGPMDRFLNKKDICEGGRGVIKTSYLQKDIPPQKTKPEQQKLPSLDLSKKTKKNLKQKNTELPSGGTKGPMDRFVSTDVRLSFANSGGGKTVSDRVKDIQEAKVMSCVLGSGRCATHNTKLVRNVRKKKYSCVGPGGTIEWRFRDVTSLECPNKNILPRKPETMVSVSGGKAKRARITRDESENKTQPIREQGSQGGNIGTS